MLSVLIDPSGPIRRRQQHFCYIYSEAQASVPGASNKLDE